MGLDEEKKKEIKEAMALEKVEEIEVPKDIFDKKHEEEVLVKKEVSRTTKLVKDLHDAGLIKIVENDEAVQEVILKQAHKSIENELLIIDSQGKKATQDAVYDVNKEACENYGIDKSVPGWQVKMMRAGSAFWFVIYWLVASLTVVPIVVINKGLKVVIKKVWLTAALTGLFYLIFAVGIPLLITLLDKN